MAKRPIRKCKLAPVIAAAYAIISPVNTATLKISANNHLTPSSLISNVQSVSETN